MKILYQNDTLIQPNREKNFRERQQVLNISNGEEVILITCSFGSSSYFVGLLLIFELFCFCIKF